MLGVAVLALRYAAPTWCGCSRAKDTACRLGRTAAIDLGPLVAPGIWPVVVAVVAAAVGLNMAFTSIAARAQTQGLPGAAGYIEAAIALGSVAGGLLWGPRRHARTHSTHLAGLTGVLAIGIAGCAAVSSLTTLGILVAVLGLAIAPCSSSPTWQPTR
jgi:hypothetical protein